ncbi:MAG: chemotaxis protein CheA [Pseudomonadota bacterium]
MDDNELDELKGIFLDECRENVDILEQGLLQLGQGNDDHELLNEVFRAAHSIKGGGATFGFDLLAELTHHMETLLDEMRSDKRPVNENDLELLLESVDIVRELMEARGDSDHPDRIAMQERLESSVLQGPGASTNSSASGDSNATDAIPAAPPAGYTVQFTPKPELLERGNDPLLLLKELEKLGSLKVVIDDATIPPWDSFDPKQAYLSWTATLEGDCSRAAIEEIFEWIEFDCTLVITEIAAQISEQPTVVTQSSEAPGPSVADESPAADATETPAGATAAEAPAAKDATTPAKPPAKKAAASEARSQGEGSSIRISTEKIDQLINLVGELVITQSMLNRISADGSRLDTDELRDRLTDLDRNTRELQESIMRVRMLPLATGFNRLPRLVRDLSRKLEKKVELIVDGGDTEIDKTVLERMMDPLVHLVRNALDHGLEEPQARQDAGKPETGQLRLNAYHQSGSVIIEISDDGRGINRDVVLNKARERGIVGPDDVLTDDQINKLIFAPGFSTAKEVSDVSGRGVGMDVVRRNIIDLGGHVDIQSEPGSGTTIIIRLPLTLAILNGQLVSVAGQTFVVPLLSIVETIEISHSRRTKLPRGTEVFEFRDAYVPLIRLSERFNLPNTGEGALIVVIENHGQLTGLVIDHVLGQQQAVIKSLDDNYRSIKGIAGATIMSDGSVALILDPAAFFSGTGNYREASENQDEAA